MIDTIILLESLSKHKLKLKTEAAHKMDHIELSSIVVDGLKCLNISINSDLTKKLISNAVKMALYSDASEFYTNKIMVSE